MRKRTEEQIKKDKKKGERLKKSRNVYGVKSIDLAKKLNISISTLRNIEKNLVRFPDTSHVFTSLRKLACEKNKCYAEFADLCNQHAPETKRAEISQYVFGKNTAIHNMYYGFEKVTKKELKTMRDYVESKNNQTNFKKELDDQFEEIIEESNKIEIKQDSPQKTIIDLYKQKIEIDNKLNRVLFSLRKHDKYKQMTTEEIMKDIAFSIVFN